MQFFAKKLFLFGTDLDCCVLSYVDSTRIGAIFTNSRGDDLSVGLCFLSPGGE